MKQAFAGLDAHAAADVVMREMSSWLGMDEADTRAACARVLSSMRVDNTMESLRRASDMAYREVMRQQAAKFAQWEASLEAGGWNEFLDRVTEAIKPR